MPWEIITIVFSLSVVGGVIARSIVRKKQGKSSCCCDCSACKCACERKEKTE